MSFSNRLKQGTKQTDYASLLDEVDAAGTAAQQRHGTGRGGAGRTVTSSFEDRRKADVAAGKADTARRMDTQSKAAQVGQQSDIRNAKVAAEINKAKSDRVFANKEATMQYQQGKQENQFNRDQGRKDYNNQMRELDFKDYQSRMTSLDKILATKNDQKAQWEILSETARHGFKMQEIEHYTKANIARINRDWDRNRQQLELAFEELKRKYNRDSANAAAFINGVKTVTQEGVNIWDSKSKE